MLLLLLPFTCLEAVLRINGRPRNESQPIAASSCIQGNRWRSICLLSGCQALTAGPQLPSFSPVISQSPSLLMMATAPSVTAAPFLPVLSSACKDSPLKQHFASVVLSFFWALLTSFLIGSSVLNCLDLWKCCQDEVFGFFFFFSYHDLLYSNSGFSVQVSLGRIWDLQGEAVWEVL